jgi:hypothetical protein
MGVFSSITLAIGAATVTPAQLDPVQTARTFLEAFASNPSATKKLVAADAMIVVGDIGGRYSEFLRKVRPKANWLATCSVTSLQSKPLPAQAELEKEDSPPWLKGGELALVEGTYSCTDPSGAKGDVVLSVVLKGGRVAQFAMPLLGRKH